MRIALVSPYSWTYPGGVTRHIEALAERLIEQGHHVRVLAPYDAADLPSRILHRGAAPQPLTAPDYLVPLGRTVGFKANGAVSNLSVTPYGSPRRRRSCARGVTTWSTSTSPSRRWSAGSPRSSPTSRSSGPSTPSPRAASPTAWPTSWAPAASSTACTCGSPSPRPRPGPAAGSSAATTA